MKNTLLVLLLANCLFTYAQTKIDIAKGYTSVLTFSEPIEDFKNGNPLEYDISKSNSQLIEINIKKAAFPKKGTNLIVFTKGGSIYQIDLILKPAATNYIHVIDESKATVKGTKNVSSSSIKESITTALSNTTEVISNTVNDIIYEDTVETMTVSTPSNLTELDKVKNICKENEKRKRRIVGIVNKSYNIIMSLRDVAFEGDMQYLFFDIKNKGGQAYDVEWINFYKSTSETGENTTSQKNLLNTYYIHNSPTRINGKSKYSFIAVMNKTSINENKAITVRIKELGGERNLLLNVKHQIINNPVKL